MLGYVNYRPFVQHPTRSIFVDGEIALMLGARRLIADGPPLCRPHAFAHRSDGGAHALPSGSAVPSATPTSAGSSATPSPSPPYASATISMAPTIAISLTTGLSTAEAETDSCRKPVFSCPSSRWMVIGRMARRARRSGWRLTAFNLIDLAFAEDQYQRAKAEFGPNCPGFPWSR